MIDFTSLQQNANQVEVNSLTKGIVEKKSNTEGVEIFSAIINGKDLTKYGDKVDKVMAYMKNLGERALNDDFKAKAEINAIRTVMIQAPLLKRLNLFDFMGNVERVGFNEEVRYKVYELQGKKAGSQANSGSFSFPTSKYRTEILKTQAITGGLVIDYREIATGNTDAMGIAQEQVITDMMNQMFYYVITSMYEGVKNATSVKNFAENDGILKSAVDEVRKKARRFGNVTITGDYSVISQMEDFAGFTTDVAKNVKLFSEAVMEEVRKTGFLKSYYGHNVVEIPNTYDFTRLNADKTFYDTYLPEGLLFFLPKTDIISPLQVGIRGDVRSMSATDINLAAEVQRFDLEFGSTLIKEYVPMVGLVSDSNYTVDKRR